MKKAMIVSMLLFACQSAHAGMFITEFMYSGWADNTTKASEFIEFTNTGSLAIDMTGWSFDDNSQTPGSVDLSLFGLVQPGESLILCEGTADDFRAAWGLSSSIKIVGDNSNNLGRSDEINLYDSSSQLVDRLTYNDQGSGNVQGPRARYFSANAPDKAALGANNFSMWILSSIGDVFGSYASVNYVSNVDVANPGICTVPEPVTLAFLAFGGLEDVGADEYHGSLDLGKLTVKTMTDGPYEPLYAPQSYSDFGPAHGFNKAVQGKKANPHDRANILFADGHVERFVDRDNDGQFKLDFDANGVLVQLDVDPRVFDGVLTLGRRSLDSFELK